MLVGLVLIHKPLKAIPGKVLQQTMKHDILMPHGVASFRVLIVGKTSKPRRIHAMRPVHQIKPDSRGSSPAMTAEIDDALCGCSSAVFDNDHADARH
jgi:hypothetical protein